MNSGKDVMTILTSKEDETLPTSIYGELSVK